MTFSYHCKYGICRSQNNRHNVLKCTPKTSLYNLSSLGIKIAAYSLCTEIKLQSDLNIRQKTPEAKYIFQIFDDNILDNTISTNKCTMIKYK